MDFLKLLRSLEEFLYELCTWFLFFPRTLYRVIVYPRRMAQYVDTELKEKLERQFDDAISPPMFLMLAVLVAHGVELMLHQQVVGTGALSRSIFGNEESLLLYRSITFAIWPLVTTTHLLRRKHVPMTRESLRRPFFMQCYLTAPFAVALSTSMVFVRLPGQLSTTLGVAVGVLAALWYAVVQAGWLKIALQRSWLNTILSTVWVLVLGAAINMTIGVILLSSWGGTADQPPCPAYPFPALPCDPLGTFSWNGGIPHAVSFPSARAAGPDDVRRPAGQRLGAGTRCVEGDVVQRTHAGRYRPGQALGGPPRCDGHADP